MGWAADLFGPQLLVKVDDKTVTVDTDAHVASKKLLVLYFSAHWCGPCRKFTPMLSITYEDLTDKNELEVIFISSDNEEEEFDEYFGEMPWASLPWDAAANREAIGEKFGVQGIPRVVVLNAATGAVVDDDARSKIAAKKTLSGLFTA